MTGTTIFYAIGDVPYTDSQADTLRDQMQNLPDDAEFVVHVGDLRSAKGSPRCVRSDYEDVSDILRLSHAPVFMLIGDNDWTDCPNQEEGLALFEEYFVGFEGRYWSHDFDIQRQSGYPNNFAFVHKGTLYVGLNLVGGSVHDSSEWQRRLWDEVEWLKDLVRDYRSSISPLVGRVVIFGHAEFTSNHDDFVEPLDDFIYDELNNELPML